MKKSTAASAVLLSLLMLAAPVVSSCGEAASSSAPGQTASADGVNASADETTAPSSPDGLAPADFEGYDFRIASCNFFDHELATYLVYDELTGNPVNDELYNAKLNVENRFNVNIRWIELGDVDGVYNGVESVSVALAADGEIRYTTDGSVPTLDSPLYADPLTLEGTSVVRAVSFEEGCLPSRPLDLSYILNENHTLPVVSVMGDPTELMGRRGVYYDVERERETAGAVEFFEDEGSFSIECGIKHHGMTSKRASGKKSLKLCFRSRYDGELNYDLFGNGVTEFASILLRSDIETNLPTLMRDNLMHQAAIDCFPEMPTLDHRYAVLYINGQYWGLYSIREAHSAAHYAGHYGYDADSITVWKGLWDRNSETAKVCTFALYNDLKDDDNYAYVAEHLNIDSIIGWCVIEAWCSNFDSSPGNSRYYYSAEDDMMRYGLSDLDLGMFDYPAFDVPLIGATDNGGLHTYAYNVVPRRLMYNRQFQLEMARQLSDALHGKMSDESMLALIDRYHDELLPEMGRNMLRWFKVKDAESGIFLWERNVEDLRSYVRQYGGRSKAVISSFRRFADALSDEEFAQFFGDLS